MPCDILTVNDTKYTVLRLLGKGKGGYSYLVTDGRAQYVLKQIHHEPCDYYTFGDKLQSELRDYKTLRTLGIPMPELLAADMQQERISDLNDLAQAVDKLSETDIQKLCAAAVLADPKSAVQIKYLAEHLDLFTFVSPQHAPEPWRDESRDEMLRMTLRVNGKPDYTLVLPADEEYLDAVKAYLDIDIFCGRPAL